MWRIVGASATGTSHTRDGLPCQDAFQYHRAASMALVAVADGLGTAPRSELGSRVAADAVVAALAEQFDPLPVDACPPIDDVRLKERMAHAFAAARWRLEETAAAEDIPLRHLATTLMAAVCTPYWLVVGHLGDGAVIGYWANDELKLVSEPQQGEYANTTKPLTADNALEHVRITQWADAPQALLLMTDGLQHLALDIGAGVPFEGFVRPFIDSIGHVNDEEKACQSLLSFLDSDRVNERTDDDKTLLIIGREPGPVAQAGKPYTPPAQAEVDEPPPDGEDVRMLNDHLASALEIDADWLERQAQERLEGARRLMAELGAQAYSKRSARQTWNRARRMIAEANELKGEAAEKRTEAQALRESDNPSRRKHRFFRHG